MALKGVNLGGWLVLERWMTPSLFAGTDAPDEWTFMQTKGAADTLQHHRQTFITEQDFIWIANNGLDAVRIPVGYWIVAPDGPYVAGLEYLDWAYKMAEKYTLKILLDMHGAPESQNGHDHSGKRGKAGWYTHKNAQQRTIDALQTLNNRYKNSPSHWGIELLNEPRFGLFQFTLRRFYHNAAKALRGSEHIVFHDAYTPRLMNGALRRKGKVSIDIHLYHMTSWVAKFVSAKTFVALSGRLYTRLLRRISRTQTAIIGEWSVVLSGKSLRGIDKPTAEQLMRQFGETQQKVYNAHAEAWFYWSYKTESSGVWSYRTMVERGWIKP